MSAGTWDNEGIGVYDDMPFEDVTLGARYASADVSAALGKHRSYIILFSNLYDASMSVESRNVSLQRAPMGRHR